MTDAERTQVYNILIKEHGKLEIKLIELKEITAPISPENAIGRISRMDAINNKSVNEVSLRNAESKMNGINRSLEMINDKDFGLCVICNHPIPIGRLIVMPGSFKCVRCMR